MWLLFLNTIAMPVLLIEVGHLTRAGVTPWAIVNLCAYPFIVAASIALHEGGHALVARLVGLQVPRVELGIGRPVARWRWGATRFAVNVFPSGGKTYLAADRVEGARWRLWISTLAGPAVTLAIAVLSASHAFHGWRALLWPSDAVVQGPAIIELFAFLNVWMAGFNLLPLGLVVRTAGQSDGTGLAKIPFMPERRVREGLVVSHILEAKEQMAAAAHDAAQRTLDEALAIAPASFGVRNSLALLQLARGELAPARTSLLALVADPEGTLDERLIIRSNLAWVDFRLHADELRAEADEHSAAAYAHFRLVGAVLGTRAAVLGWLGRHDEAIVLGGRAYARNTEQENRALNACCVAVSHAALGHVVDAADWIARARACDPACKLLPEAEAALARARAMAMAPVV